MPLISARPSTGAFFSAPSHFVQRHDSGGGSPGCWNILTTVPTKTPSFSTMLNQLSALPVFSSTCSHKPTAVGWPPAGAAHAAELNDTKTAIVRPRNFIATSVHPYRLMAVDCGGLWATFIMPPQNESPRKDIRGLASASASAAVRLRIAAE